MEQLSKLTCGKPAATSQEVVEKAEEIYPIKSGLK
jgi:hypothetical protein